MRGPGSGGLPELATLFAPLAGFGRIGLAVSGGPDSLALLVLAAQWAANDPSRSLTVFTVDHGLRPEAAGEAEMVCAEAGKLGLACHVLTWLGEKPETGLQAAARSARYRLIGEAMRKDGIEVLVTAHHADDQAETVLMRMAHGSGLSGLGAMGSISEIEGIPVCRPLLGVTGDVLARVTREAGLTPANDPSNADLGYERVRWRQALPAFAGLGLDAGRLAEFASRARRADAALSRVAATAFDELTKTDGFGAITLARPAFDALDAEIGLRVLAEGLRRAGGARRPYSLRPVEDLHDALRNGTATTRSLSGVLIRAGAQRVILTREPGRMEVEPMVVRAGETVVWDGRFEISLRQGAADVQVRPAGELTRRDVEALIGIDYAGQMSAARTAPHLLDMQQGTLGLGCHMVTRTEDVKVALRTKW